MQHYSADLARMRVVSATSARVGIRPKTTIEEPLSIGANGAEIWL